MIVFEKAAVGGVKHKVKSGVVASQIEVVAIFDSKVAAQLGNKWIVFDRDDFPREGMKAVEMDYELQGQRLKMVPRGLESHSLDLHCDRLDKFKVFKSGSKKKRVSVRVKFMAHCSGNPFDMLEYLMHAGGAEGRLELTPTAEQQELSAPTEEKKKPGRKKKADPEQGEMPASAESPAPSVNETPAPEEETKPVDPETPATAIETDRWEDEGGPAARFPQPDESGNFSIESAQKKDYAGRKVVIVLYSVAVAEGWAWGYSLTFDFSLRGFNDEHQKPSLTTIVTSEAYSWRMAAEAVYRSLMNSYNSSTPQVRSGTIKPAQDWLVEFINAGKPQPQQEVEEAVAQ